MFVVKYSRVAFTLFLFAVLLLANGGCGSGGTSDQLNDVSGSTTTTANTDVSQFSVMQPVSGGVSLPQGSKTPIYRINVPENSKSLTIIANGRGASDIDISKVTDPDGLEIVKENSYNYPIGYNWSQANGVTALSLTIPYNEKYQLRSGDWLVQGKHYSSVDGQPKIVDIYYYIKSNDKVTEGIMNINLFIVGIPDYDGPNDQDLQLFLSELSYLLTKLGLSLGAVDIYNLNDNEIAFDNRIIDTAIDYNGNGNPDAMDNLFKLSSLATNSNYLNIYLIYGFSSGSILGISGGIPGPVLLTGTENSGVVVNTFGSLSMLARYKEVQAETVAHEVGHYLGLFHTTERTGAFFDSIGDTAECKLSVYDKNGDGMVSASECDGVDGRNLMFWASSNYFNQDYITETQKMVFEMNPVIE